MKTADGADNRTPRPQTGTAGEDGVDALQPAATSSSSSAPWAEEPAMPTPRLSSTNTLARSTAAVGRSVKRVQSACSANREAASLLKTMLLYTERRRLGGMFSQEKHRMPQPNGPLQGVKVVACSTAQAGTVPYMLMADLGAEVIKIEVPEVGDNSRGSSVMPGFPSTYFETNNRGVRSVTLNLKAPEGQEILRQLVAKADIFGQNFRPGAAEKNGFGYEDLRQVNPKLVYISISGYGPDGPNAALPGTDSMAQALGGIAEAYSTPGQPLRTGIVSVADETCAILAFGGALAALTHARATGIGQKVDCSLLGGQIRLMGWTLTTAMWRNRDPVTGQARVTGTQDRPGISASFNDGNGKPLVFQLNGGRQWRNAMTALGFYERLEIAGFGDLGVIINSEEKRATLF